MRRLLLTAAALLTLSGTASAIDLPMPLRKQQGVSWCEENLGRNAGWWVIRYRDAIHDCGGSTFAMERDGFSWEDISCEALRASKAMRIDSFVRVGKEAGSYSLEWEVTARCTYYGGIRDRHKIETFRINLFKGTELTIFSKTQQ